MSDVPAARGILEALRNDILAGNVSTGRAAEKIGEALELMTREPYERKTAPRSRGMSAAKVMEIKRRLSEQPDTSIQDIAVQAGVNAGRVSEVAHGKWDHLVW